MQELRQPSDQASFPDSTAGPEPIHVIWVGDAIAAQRIAGRRAPHVRIEEVTAVEAAGRIRSDHRPDLVVLDVTLPSVESTRILDVFEVEGIDLPLVLLTPPGNDALPSRAIRLGACDCIVKTPDFVHQLLPTINQVRARHELRSLVRSGRFGDGRPEDRLEPLQKALEQARAEIDGLREERDRARAERQTAEQQQQDASEHVMTALRDAEIERERLAEALQAVTADLEALTAERQLPGAVAQVAPTGEQPHSDVITALEAECNRLRAELEAVQTFAATPALELFEHEQLTASLDSANARAQSMADTVAHLEATIGETEARVQLELERAERAEAESRSFREELERVTEESRLAQADASQALEAAQALASALDELHALRSVHEALVADRSAIETRLNEALAQSAAMQEEREDTARQHQTAAAAHAAAIIELQTRRDHFAQAALAADERSAKLADDSRAADATIENLRREFQASENRCLHLVEQLSERQIALDRAAADQGVLAASLAAAERRLATLAELGTSLQSGHDDLHALRQALARFLVDADMRCKAIASRQADLLSALPGQTGVR